MICKTINTALFLVLFLFSSTDGFCKGPQDTLIVTDEFPPYSFYKNGKLTGIAVSIVKELMEMAGHSGKITALPWKRALVYSKTKKIILFPLTRLAYRENNYKWIGPIMVDSAVFAVRSSEKRAFETIDAFRNVRIGVNRGSPASQRLKELRFANIQQVSSDRLNAQKLVVGNRIDAWYCSHLIALYTMRMEGLDENLLRIAYKDMDVEMYIGASLSVPDDMVAQWQKTLDEMKETDKYQDLIYDSILEWEKPLWHGVAGTN